MKFLRTKVICNYIFILSIVFFALPKVVMGAELIQNGDFETNDFTGWTVLDNGVGNFLVYSGTALPQSGNTVLAPPEGNFAAITDQDAGGDHIIYQDISIPANSNATFSAIVYIENIAGNYSKPTPDSLSFLDVPNQQMRVDIMDPAAPIDDIGAGVLQNIFITNVGDPASLGYTNITADLSVFSGQTIRIRIAEVDNQLFFHGAVDAISVDAISANIAPAPIPTLSEWSMILLVLLLGFVGLRHKYIIKY